MNGKMSSEKNIDAISEDINGDIFLKKNLTKEEYNVFMDHERNIVELAEEVIHNSKNTSYELNWSEYPKLVKIFNHFNNELYKTLSKHIKKAKFAFNGDDNNYIDGEVKKNEKKIFYKMFFRNFNVFKKKNKTLFDKLDKEIGEIFCKLREYKNYITENIKANKKKMIKTLHKTFVIKCIVLLHKKELIYNKPVISYITQLSSCLHDCEAHYKMGSKFKVFIPVDTNNRINYVNKKKLKKATKKKKERKRK